MSRVLLATSVVYGGAIELTRISSQEKELTQSRRIRPRKEALSVCEVIQHGVVALVLPPGLSPLDDSLVKSMCHHFQMPCLAIQSKNEKDVGKVFPIWSTPSVSDFVSFVGPSRGLASLATSQFLDSLRWTSFLLAYQHDSGYPPFSSPLSISLDLEDLSPLIYARSETDLLARRPSIRVRQLPKNTRDFEPFLKYIRTRLKQSNIVGLSPLLLPSPFPDYSLQ